MFVRCPMAYATICGSGGIVLFSVCFTLNSDYCWILFLPQTKIPAALIWSACCSEHASLVQSSRLDKLRNLIFASLIGVAFPDLVQADKLLRCLHHSFDIHVALCQPIY